MKSRIPVLVALLTVTITAAVFISCKSGDSKKETQTITPVTTDITGEYIHTSQHEYGTDSFVYYIKPNNVAAYTSEAEGRDSEDLQGTWTWDEAKQQVTVKLNREKEQLINVLTKVNDDLKIRTEYSDDSAYSAFKDILFIKKKN